MNSKSFVAFRNHFDKTQAEMARILGSSITAVRSYEQGWRKVPAHVERQVLFLASRMWSRAKPLKPCWTIKNCKPGICHECPAWEFKAGTICWFISGTLCAGKPKSSWAQKLKLCRKCEVFQMAFPPEVRD